jgi:hypothetical protein
MMQTKGMVAIFKHMWYSSIQTLLSIGQECHRIECVVMILKSHPQLHQEPNPAIIIVIFNRIKCHWKDTIIRVNSSGN